MYNIYIYIYNIYIIYHYPEWQKFLSKVTVLYDYNTHLYIYIYIYIHICTYIIII